MKKYVFALIAGLMAVLMTGCSALKFDGIKQTIVGENYEAAGEIVGEAGFYAYQYLKQDKKYAEYCGKMEKVYSQIENGELTAEGIGVINEVAMLVSEEALKAKYSDAEVFLIIRAIRIAGAIADRGVSSRIDKNSADKFFNGFMIGIAKAKGQWIEPTPKPEDEPFICPDGNCKIDGLRYKNELAYQKALAKKLLTYADKNEVLTEDKIVTDYENLTHLIEHCEQLESYKVKKTLVVVDSFIIKDSKLTSVSFLKFSSDHWVVSTCVNCEGLPELWEENKEFVK